MTAQPCRSTMKKAPMMCSTSAQARWVNDSNRRRFCLKVSGRDLIHAAQRWPVGAVHTYM